MAENYLQNSIEPKTKGMLPISVHHEQAIRMTTQKLTDGTEHNFPTYLLEKRQNETTQNTCETPRKEH